MPISLNGLASGLDTESIISQLMAIEQNKVTAVQRRQIAVQQHKTDLTTIKTKLDAVKTAAADLASATTWKPAQIDELVRPDQGRRQDARGRRHRRPFARGPQDGLLGPARLLVHPERGRGLAHALLRLRSERGRQLEAHPHRCRQRDRDRRRDADQRQRGLARVRGRRQGRRRRAPGVLRPQDRRELELHGRHLRAGRRPDGRGAGLRPHRHGAQRLLHARRRGFAAQLGVQRHRERHPGRPADAEGHHQQPRVGQHRGSRRRHRGDRQEDHRARRRLQRRRLQHALRDHREEDPDRVPPARTSRRASSSATPA